MIKHCQNLSCKLEVEAFSQILIGFSGQQYAELFHNEESGLWQLQHAALSSLVRPLWWKMVGFGEGDRLEVGEKLSLHQCALSGTEDQHQLSHLSSSSFYQAIYAEIEEIGWEHLLRLEEDLSSLSFRVIDKNERVHSVEIILPCDYPQSMPSIAADVPYVCDLHWSKNSRLKDAMQQFLKHLEKLQEFWSILDDVDRNLWVVETRKQSYASTFRQICLGNDCHILLSINPKKPRSLPECRFLGPDLLIESLKKNWKRNSRRWIDDKPFPENLKTLLGFALPRPPCVTSKENEQAECGICYVHLLPFDDGLRVKTGIAVDYTCDNPNCSKAFHTVCLRDWLHSITTTRQSFDVLFGKCPYCSEALAVKVNNIE